VWIVLTIDTDIAPESDGFVITMACRQDKFITSILILDTAKLSEGPVAMIELPFRLRLGIHGSWVPASQLLQRKELCDMEGVTDEILHEFQNKPVLRPDLSQKAIPVFPPNGVPPPGGSPPFDGINSAPENVNI
jgi:carotenoid cleavage dioxygenase